MKIIRIMTTILLLTGVVACEGTIDFGEASQDQMVAPTTGAGAGGKADTIADPTDTSGGDEGAALYQQHCGACHGADATGGSSYPNSIVGYEPIDDIVKNGSGVMPAIAIGDSEIAAIQTFLLGDVEDAEPTPTVDGSSPALEVYSANCAACHGTEGAGTPQGPDIRIRVPDFAEFAVRQGRNGAGNPSAMPAFDHGQVTEAQLDEMVEWLDSFPNPTTGEGLYNRYCASCHGEDGLGGPSFEPVAGRSRVDIIVRTGHALGRYAERTEYMPAWTEEQLSDAEIDLIEGYLMQM